MPIIVVIISHHTAGVLTGAVPRASAGAAADLGRVRLVIHADVAAASASDGSHGRLHDADEDVPRLELGQEGTGQLVNAAERRPAERDGAAVVSGEGEE